MEEYHTDLSIKEIRSEDMDSCFGDICDDKTAIVKEEITLDGYSIDRIDKTNYVIERKPLFCQICSFDEEITPMEDTIADDFKLCCDNCYKIDYNIYCIVWRKYIYNLYKKCNNCKEAFKNGYSINMHNCCNLLWCNNCSAIFDHQKDFELHHKSCINKSKCYMCDICCKSFSLLSKLKYHRISHSGKNSLFYETCDKPSSVEAYSLKIQKLNPSGEKPYSCNNCSKSFKYLSSLKTHLKTHSGEKPYSCNNCSKSFSQRNSIIKHLRTHSGEKPYSCNICSRSFNQLSHLKTHLRIHSGEKPYSCNNCSKSFNQLVHLKIHLRTHYDEKPYSCNNCSKSFKHSQSLKIHLRTHSGKKPNCNNLSKS